MNQLTLKKIIYCQFCKKIYYIELFKQHLQLCTNYLKYISKNAIEWKPLDTHNTSNTSNISNTSNTSNSSNTSNTLNSSNTSNTLNSSELFISLVKNKRVIIVGPSITVQECNLGTFINNFDIIIRLNKSLPIPSKMFQHIGDRTDILYNSLNTSDFPGENNTGPLFFKQQNIKYVRCPYPPIPPFQEDIKSFCRKNKNVINFGHIDTLFYQKIENSLGTRPYTGTCAIADLLRCDVKQLYVMGIDFYTYKHSFYYRNVSRTKLKKLQNNHIHKRKPQIDLIKRFYLLDNRLVVDNILDEILLENYDNLFYSIKSNIDFEKIFLTGKGKDMCSIPFNSKICLVGDGDSSNINDMDFIIDLCPDREEAINHPNKLLVYKNRNNYKINNKILFTQAYKKDIEDVFKREEFLFINPFFAQYLKTILLKTIFSKGTLSLELFIILIYSIYFENTYISNINPEYNWKDSKEQHCIEQRMLFQYLIKRNKIKII